MNWLFGGRSCTPTLASLLAIAGVGFDFHRLMRRNRASSHTIISAKFGKTFFT
jgi:hypothetical protein